jgi:hypothetical protein
MLLADFSSAYNGKSLVGILYVVNPILIELHFILNGVCVCVCDENLLLYECVLAKLNHEDYSHPVEKCVYIVNDRDTNVQHP